MLDGDGLRSRRVGEIVEAASTSFVAQCYQLYGAPPLGSFVRTGSPVTRGTVIYGVVYGVSTLPIDTSRPVLARGETAVTEGEVFRDNPQLSRLFTTRFEALITGHLDGEDVFLSSLRQFLPPLPPEIHSFAYSCSPEEVARFTSRLGFLSLLLNSGLPIADEVTGACLRVAAAAQPDGEEFLASASRALAVQLAGDVPRLSAILRRVAT